MIDPKKICFCPYIFILFLILIIPIGSKANAASAGKEKETGGIIKGKVTNRWAKISRYPTLVYIEKIKGARYKVPKEPVTLNQIEAKFVPRLMPILKGTTVNFLNGDNTRHDVYSPDGEKYSFDEFAPGEQKHYKFDHLGPYIQLCRTHHKMKAYVVVLQNPFYTFTDDKGHFILQDVPPGNWKLRVFNERMSREDTEKTFDIMVVSGFTATMNATW